MILLDLLWRFALYGLLCFGGGYMLVPLLYNDCVVRCGTLNATQFGNLVSIAQLTPGPVGINVATFTGFIENGFWGSVAATAGLVLPTLLLSSFIVWQLKKYRSGFFMQGVLTGVRPAALGLIFYAALLFFRLSVYPEGFPWKELSTDIAGAAAKIDWISFAIFIAIFTALQKTKIPAPVWVLGGAALGAFAVWI